MTETEFSLKPVGKCFMDCFLNFKMIIGVVKKFYDVVKFSGDIKNSRKTERILNEEEILITS